MVKSCFSSNQQIQKYVYNNKVNLHCLTDTLADRAAVPPPYWGSSEQAIGSEDWGGFREWRQGRGRCRGALGQAHRRRAFGQCCLGEGNIRHQIHLKNKAVKSGETSVWSESKTIFILIEGQQSEQILTGCAAALGSEDLRWAIIACSRSLSFFNCVRWEDRNRRWELVHSQLVLNDEMTFSVGIAFFPTSWEV